MKHAVFVRSTLVASVFALALFACGEKKQNENETATQVATETSETIVAETNVNPEIETIVSADGWILKPGKWEISGTTISQGVSITIPPNSICLAEAVPIAEKMDVTTQSNLGDTQTPTCTTKNKGIVGNKLRITTECGAPANQKIDVAISKIADDEYSIMSDVVTQINGMEVQSSTEMAYKYAGACDA